MRLTHDNFGDMVRARRLGARLTQRELAARAGVGVRTVRDIERGIVRNPQSRSVHRLVGALGLPGGQHPPFPTHTGMDTGDAEARLSVAALGPLSVRYGEAAVDIPTHRLRCVLALLAIYAGEAVPTADIIDTLWGERPPMSCRRLVRGCLRHLRDLLEPRRPSAPDRVLVATRGGYRLDLPGEELDTVRFVVLAGRAWRARAVGDTAQAMALFDEALACWRGPLLADIDGRIRQNPAVVALRDKRLDAALAHADLALKVGRYGSAVTRLRDLLPEEPLHEALHARLILALAGTGRQAAALDLFATLRGRLAGELGIAPGPLVRAAHLRVLRQDLPPAA